MCDAWSAPGKGMVKRRSIRTLGRRGSLPRSGPRGPLASVTQYPAQVPKIDRERHGEDSEDRAQEPEGPAPRAGGCQEGPSGEAAAEQDSGRDQDTVESDEGGGVRQPRRRTITTTMPIPMASGTARSRTL